MIAAMEMVYPSKLRISISQTYCFFGHEAIKILNHTPICHIRNVELVFLEYLSLHQ